MKTVEHMRKKDLLALPKRRWGAEAEYTSIVLIPSNEMHESGYPIITVVGVDWMRPVEIAAESCDVVDLGSCRVGINILPKSGLTHILARGYRLNVGADLSTLIIRPGSSLFSSSPMPPL